MGRYRIIRSLSETARSRTLLAVDRDRSETVVVKTHSAATLAAVTRARFLEECHRLQELRETAPRPLLDAGQYEDQLYVIRSYLPGTSLQRRLSDRHLSLLESLRVAVCICTTLQDLHARRILHRNLKPANIIVSEQGTIQRATLVDPGILVDELLYLEGCASLDLVPYLSPEQTGSVDLDVGEPADLYSAGIVLFQCLTGQLPFQAATVGEVLLQHLTAPVPQLQTVYSIPPVVDEVVRRLLHKDPRDRYQSAAAVVKDLLSILNELERGNTAPTLPLGVSDRRHTLTEPTFVGRDRELRAIHTELEAVRTSGSQLLLLEGAAGSGKSRLLAEVARHCTLEGTWVMRGAAADDLDHTPFRALEGIVRQFTTAARATPALANTSWRQLRGYREGLCAALPELAQELGWDTVPEKPSTIHEARKVKGLARFLTTLGTQQRPAIIILDDCQWCDELTIKLLEAWHGLTRESSNHHVLLIAAFRTEDVPDSHALRQLDHAPRVQLGPLAASAVRELVQSMAGPVPEAVQKTIVRMSSGSPFMASALLRGLVESGALLATDQGWESTALELDKLRSSRQAGAVLARRIELLPPESTEVLQAAAILGRQFDLGVVAGLTQRSQASLLAALDLPRSATSSGCVPTAIKASSRTTWSATCCSKGCTTGSGASCTWQPRSTWANSRPLRRPCWPIISTPQATVCKHCLLPWRRLNRHAASTRWSWPSSSMRSPVAGRPRRRLRSVTRWLAGWVTR